MDEQSQQQLADIIAKGPDAISEADAAFLRSRVSYLSEEQQALFKVALAAAPAEDASAKPSKAKKDAE